MKIGERNVSCNHIVTKRNVLLFIMQRETMVAKVLLKQKWEILEIVEFVIACSYKSVVDYQEDLVIELHYFFFFVTINLGKILWVLEILLHLLCYLT